MLLTKDFQKVRFGPYEADFRRGELRKYGIRIKIQGKPLSLLALLVRTPGETVFRDTLRHSLWPDDVYVDFDKNLTTTVNKLRTALGDAADKPRYIETVPRLGYRFIGTLEVVPEERPAATPELMQPVNPKHAAASVPVLSVEAPTSAPAPPSTASFARRARWIIAAVIVFSAVSIFAIVHLVRGGQAGLSAKDLAVVADFANTTGDPVFDGALRQGLSSQLEQSPFLNLLSDARISQTLALMERHHDTHLSAPVAREVCMRTGSVATIEGSISRMGTEYVLDLAAVNCKTGDTLAQEQQAAGSKEEVLNALGLVATRLRHRLGESLPSVQANDAPPENVTTTSLEALQAYSIGYHHLQVDNESVSASPFFQRAIILDPNFAMAYARLGQGYDAEGDRGLAAQYFTRAHQLRKRASEREEFYIDSYYEYIVTGDLEAAVKSFQLWAQTYPLDASPHHALGDIFMQLGYYRQSLTEFRTALKLDPSVGLSYGSLVIGLVQQGHFDEAQAIAQEAQDRNLDSNSQRVALRWGAWAQGQPYSRDKLGPTIDRPLANEWVLLQDAAMAAFAGQIIKARILTQISVDGYRRYGRVETWAHYLAESALREALVGNLKRARTDADTARSQNDSPHVRACAAVALALAGETEEASRTAVDLASKFPEATVVQRNYLPAIRAAIALRNSQPNQAIQALEPASPYELGTLGYALLPLYLRGEALLMLRNGDKAASEFGKLSNVCPSNANLTCSLARLQIARSYVLSGKTAQAKRAYDQFFSLWKAADPDTPVFMAAKAEYRRLQ